ncbi:MAG: hypothetical protein LBE60_11615 [Microbacterium sp.]|jgi:ribosomal protein L12E/L44/L45/RPP1/RPP2|uniref:hypothetical protein n=1 Tax=Microbacterium sp. TaxID=51671 RepID=UPI00281C65BD|nr:hypothetical protein [Microbacterium sp.]MDR2322281.1 hypothetical protein [Microbacterium sp.]
MISSGLMIAVLVVVAIAVVVTAILVRVLLRRRARDDRGIGVTLPSGAVLNPSSADPQTADRQSAAPAHAGPMPTAPAPDASPSGARPIPDDVVRLVSEGRTAEAVTALMTATGRQDPAWAQRAVDSLSTMDLAEYLADGRVPDGATSSSSSSTTTSTSISWSSSASRRGSADPQSPGTTASSFSAKLPDEIIALVRQGRTPEAEARIRSQLGIGADQARHVVETIARLPL